jgi:hypothetical protein
MVPSLRMLYPDGIIHFQQDHSSIHDSRVVREWLSLQADVKLIHFLRYVSRNIKSIQRNY